MSFTRPYTRAWAPRCASSRSTDPGHHATYRPYAVWKDGPHLARASEHARRLLVTYALSDCALSELFNMETAEPGTAVRLARMTLAEL